MSSITSFPYQEALMELQDGEEIVLHIGSVSFVVKKASEADIERVNQGHFVL
ncbi:hypothetical protein [Paenibacillus pinisoli]|uniref:hypothetical protein n=1 Tax=Paenibacillus pinisoli TaxID=1276110 RepID=UPI001402191A|nr:hypothetical protein [Paenibacillus pinisoli]